MKISTNGRIRSFAILFADVFSLAFSLLAVFYLYRRFGAKYEMSIVLRTWPLFILMLGFNLSGRLYCGNLFYPGLVIHPAEELRRLMQSCVGSFLVFFAILSLVRGNMLFSRVALLASMALCVILLPLNRIVVRYLLWKFRLGIIPTVITGGAEQAKAVTELLVNDPYSILQIRASCCGVKVAEGIPDLSWEELLALAKRESISYLIYCNRGDREEDGLGEALPHFLHVLVVNNSTKFPVLWSYPVSFYRYFSFEIGNRLLRRGGLLQKRLLEIVLAGIGVVLAFLPGVVLALLVKLSTRGSVFYRAKRLGQYGKPIEVLKFRTMHADADKELERLLAENPELKEEWEKNFKLHNDPRVTRIGRFLRRTSLDELPQFWNVLKGEMALIGPRPIVPREVPLYGKDYPVFASVKPGITGLWQVSGRSDVSYSERVALDVFYVNNWSIWLDCYIFWATFNAVLFCRGAR